MIFSGDSSYNRSNIVKVPRIHVPAGAVLSHRKWKLLTQWCTLRTIVPPFDVVQYCDHGALALHTTASRDVEDLLFNAESGLFRDRSGSGVAPFMAANPACRIRG
jgi:hypothetical protein